jgi:pimeloyl-ACP methyl ester carboxylesterase
MAHWQSDPVDLNRLTQPMLILRGERSSLSPDVGVWKSAFSHASLLELPDTDHALVTQAPTIVATVIAEFLSMHPIRR